MADKDAAEGTVGKISGTAAKINSPHSESNAVIPDPPHVMTTKGVTRHVAGRDDTIEVPTENADIPNAGHGTKLVTVLSPVSPPSLASRANFKAENLRGTSADQHGFNKSPLSIGSVIANVTAPVLTGSKDGSKDGSHQMLGLGRTSVLPPPPPHTSSHHGTVSYLGSSQTEESTTLSNSFGSRAQASSFETYASSIEPYERPSTAATSTLVTMDDILGANPYLRRADEIGVRHQVPGIGHLGGILVPPGWKEGDSPITPGEAKRLFDFSRQAAVNDLNMTLAQQQYLSNEEKDRYAASIDDHWNARLILDQTVLTERVVIFKQHHERQRRNIEHSRERERVVPQYRLLEFPQPVQRRAGSSLLPGPPSELPFSQRMPKSQNQIDSRFGDPGRQQNFGLWPSQMSPETTSDAFDRNHISSRMESVYNPSQPNHDEVAWHALEKQHFDAYGSAYGPSRAHEQLLQRMTPSSVGARSTMSYEGNNVRTHHHGYPVEQAPISRHRNETFSYSSYPHVGSFGVEYPRVGWDGFEESPFPRPGSHQHIQAGYRGPNITNMYHSCYDPSIYGRPYGDDQQYNIPQTAIPPIRDQPGRGEKSFKNPGYEIPKTGLLPISGPSVPELSKSYGQEPSSRAQQTKYEQTVDKRPLDRESNLTQPANYKEVGVRRTLDQEQPNRVKEPLKATKVAEARVDKTRQWYDDEIEMARLPSSIPSKEFVRAALEEAEKERAGAKATPSNRRPKPEIDASLGFTISNAAAKLLALKGVPDRRHQQKAASSYAMPSGKAASTSIPPAPGGLSGSYNPKPPANVNYLYSRRQREVMTPESENGSDRVEDPADGDYGKRKTRRKTTTPRKKQVSHTTPASKTRRKTAGSFVPNKRRRLSVDDLTNNSENDAEGSDDPATQEVIPDCKKKSS